MRQESECSLFPNCKYKKEGERKGGREGVKEKGVKKGKEGGRQRRETQTKNGGSL